MVMIQSEQSDHKYTHVTTDQLSSHVYISDLIGLVES